MSKFVAPEANNYETRDDKNNRLLNLMRVEGYLKPNDDLLYRGVYQGHEHVKNLKYSPLHTAAAYNDTKAAEFLIKNDADINDRDINKKTPLDLAIINNNKSMSKLLIEHGASVYTEYIQENMDTILREEARLDRNGEDNIFKHILAAKWNWDFISRENNDSIPDITGDPEQVKIIRTILKNELIQNEDFNLNNLDEYQALPVFRNIITNDFKKSVAKGRATATRGTLTGAVKKFLYGVNPEHLEPTPAPAPAPAYWLSDVSVTPLNPERFSEENSHKNELPQARPIRVHSGKNHHDGKGT